MLKAVSPDVVHITTPPQSHCTLAKECLEAGSHVYLEKPFTVTGEEAESLIELAEHKNIKITAGHNLQFTLEMLEMRRLMREGFVGGEPAHLESYFSYDLGDPDVRKRAFARPKPLGAKATGRLAPQYHQSWSSQAC